MFCAPRRRTRRECQYQYPPPTSMRHCHAGLPRLKVGCSDHAQLQPPVQEPQIGERERASAVRGSTAAARPQNQPMSSTTRYYCTCDNNTVRRPPLCVPPGLLGTRQERSRHGQILTHPLEAFTCSSCSPPAASPRQAGRWPSFYRPALGAAGETR